MDRLGPATELDDHSLQQLLHSCRESASACRARLERSRAAMAHATLRLRQAEATCAATERSLGGDGSLKK